MEYISTTVWSISLVCWSLVLTRINDKTLSDFRNISNTGLSGHQHRLLNFPTKAWSFWRNNIDEFSFWYVPTGIQ